MTNERRERILAAIRERGWPISPTAEQLGLHLRAKREQDDDTDPEPQDAA